MERSFGWLLEEIHVTWAHLKKKRTRLRLYTKSLEESIIQTVEMASPAIVTASELDQDGAKIFKMASRSSRLKRNPRNFIEAMASRILPTIDQADRGKLRDKNAKESWALLGDLTLVDNESWNDPRDFAKPVKAISLPQDVSSTSDRRLIELENQVQRLMEACWDLLI
ncbi:hypothetical protein Tco_0717922 [Tanacetum coccineum]